MTAYRLGVNTCFVVKRWPDPPSWAPLCADVLGVDLVEHSLDLVDLHAGGDALRAQADAVREACARHGLDLHSTFTGLAAYSANLLLHPDRDFRDRASAFLRLAVDFTAACGAGSFGGHVGAFSVADWADPARRAALEAELRERLAELAAYAHQQGLEGLMVENLAVAREPSTMAGMEALLDPGDERHVPIELCLDVGHHCVVGTAGEERDPYAWARRMGRFAPVVQLQQTDGAGDHHWPFTADTNAKGLIQAGRLLDALDASGASDIALIIEVIPAFEADDDDVVREMAASVAYWRTALDERGRG
jgi:sugar phosphate isomerase/epimerase